jgi:hypothetical protein
MRLLMTDPTFEELEELLDEPTVPQQKGPLRRYEREMQCLNTWGVKKISCRAPTYLKLNGIPLCSVHALWRMNDIIMELTGEADGD